MHAIALDDCRHEPRVAATERDGCRGSEIEGRSRLLAISHQLVLGVHADPGRPDDAWTAKAGGIDDAVLLEDAGSMIIPTLPNQLYESRTLSNSGKRFTSPLRKNSFRPKRQAHQVVRL